MPLVARGERSGFQHQPRGQTPSGRGDRALAPASTVAAEPLRGRSPGELRDPEGFFKHGPETYSQIKRQLATPALPLWGPLSPGTSPPGERRVFGTYIWKGAPGASPSSSPRDRETPATPSLPRAQRSEQSSKPALAVAEGPAAGRGFEGRAHLPAPTADAHLCGRGKAGWGGRPGNPRYGCRAPH